MELKLQECNENYWLDILDIRNNDNTGFVNQTNISTELHIQYMKNNFQNYRICILNNEFAGFIGIVNDDVRLGVKKEFKRKGIGKFMINEFNKTFEIKHAKVKIENTASQKLFESCGFKKTFYILTKNET